MECGEVEWITRVDSSFDGPECVITIAGGVGVASLNCSADASEMGEFFDEVQAIRSCSGLSAIQETRGVWTCRRRPNGSDMLFPELLAVIKLSTTIEMRIARIGWLVEHYGIWGWEDRRRGRMCEKLLSFIHQHVCWRVRVATGAFLYFPFPS